MKVRYRCIAEWLVLSDVGIHEGELLEYEMRSVTKIPQF